jgi:hypothetical protein
VCELFVIMGSQPYYEGRGGELFVIMGSQPYYEGRGV